MAIRSIIDIEINDSGFQRFAKLFEGYRSKLESTPELWQKAAETAGAAAKATTEIGASVGAAAYALHKIGIEQTGMARSAHTQARSWNAMAKDAGKFALHIADATRSLLRWGALTGLVSGILGVGGLFGIERLAQGAGQQRAQGFALGMKPGEAKAYEVNLGGRGYDANAFLGNINKGMTDFTSEQFLGLRGLGVDTSNKDTNAVSLETLTKLKERVDRIPMGPAFAATAHNWRLDQLMSPEDLQKLRRTPAAEVGEMAGQIRKDQEALTLTGKTAKAWQELNVQLERAGATLKNVLITKLVDLAEPIGRLSKAFTQAVSDILGSKVLREWIDGLAGALERLAKFMEQPEFKTYVNSFVEGVGKAAEALWDLIKGFYHAAQAIHQWFGDPDKFNQNGPLGDNEGSPGSDAFNRKRHPDWYNDDGTKKGWNLPNPLNLWGNWKENLGFQPPSAGVQKETFNRLEGKQDLPPGLLNAVFQAESSGGKNLYSNAGAVGPFQFTQGAWADYGNGGNPLDFQDSASASARYFHKLLKEFNGDVAKAAAGYNAGPGYVERGVAEYGDNWRRGLPKPEETLPYIDKIVGALGKTAQGMHPNTGKPSINVNVYNSTGSNVAIASSQLSV